MYLAKISPETSNLTGYAVILVISYILHRKYTFKSNQKRRNEIIRFLIVFFVAYALNFLALVIFLHMLVMPDWICQVLAGIVYVVSSYIMNKFYVFKISDTN